MRTALLLALALAAGSGLAAPPVALAQPAAVEAQASEIERLMERSGLDLVFDQFGDSLVAGLAEQGAQVSAGFIEAWEQSAALAFDPDTLNRRLAAAMGEGLTAGEVAELAAFLDTPLGQTVSLLEKAVQGATSDEQMTIIGEGQSALGAASPDRRAGYEEMLALTSADSLNGTVIEAIRGMALGMHLSGGTGGDIDVPWEEIDAMVDLQVAGLEATLRQITLAVAAWTYRSLSDDEVQDYLTFLRTPQSQKFYEVATDAIGDILREQMFVMGQTVAQRMSRVRV